MKRSFILSLSLIMALFVCADMQAQLLSNKGATLTIEPGATLFVEGGVENVDGGTIDNQGKIELEGDFDNSATYTGTGDTVKFSGPGDATLTSGGASIGTLEVGKDGGNNVLLGDSASVGSELAFTSDNTKVLLGANNLSIEDNGSITGYDANNFVVTDGTGQLIAKQVGPSEDFLFPVGATTDSYNSGLMEANAGQVSDDYGVRILENVLSEGTTGDVIDEEVVKAVWVVTEGTPGGSDFDATAYWSVAGDEGMNFDANSSAMARFLNGDWDTQIGDFNPANGGDPNSKTRQNITEVGAFVVHSSTALTNSLVVGPRVFLQGGYDDATGLISDAIRVAGFIPVEEPYTMAGYTHKGLGGGEMVTDPGIFDQPADADDIVDWVVVEVRDAVEDTVVGSKSALINRDGYIVSHEDGVSSVTVDGLPDGSYYVAVKHRNHLAVRTSGTLMLDETLSAWDFTTGAGQANDIANGNAPLAEVEAGVYGMWGGDVNGNNIVTYVAGDNDKAEILTILGGAGNVLNDYSPGDVNMNGQVTYVAGDNDKAKLLEILGGAGNVINGHVTN